MMDQQPGPSETKRRSVNVRKSDFFTDLGLEMIIKNIKEEDSDSERSEVVESDGCSMDGDGDSVGHDLSPDTADADDPHFVWTDNGQLNHFAFTGKRGLLRLPSGSTPLDFFNFLVDSKFYENIVEQTNSYATELFLSGTKEKSRITQWKDLNVAELRIFIGLILHMGTIQINRIQDYWKKHRLFDFSCFSRHMGRNRFLLILRCLHFARSPGMSSSSTSTLGAHQHAGAGEAVLAADILNASEMFCEHPLHFTHKQSTHVESVPNRLYKISPIIDYFNNKMCEVYYPGKELILEESVVPWHKYGLKIYVLAEPAGFTVRINVHAGGGETPTGPGPTESMALALLQENLHKGHSVYVVNSCNSVALALRLLSCNTYCTGTLRTVKNCKEVVEARLKRGEAISKYFNGVVVGKWRDRHEVMFVSTEHTGKLSSIENKWGEIKQKPSAIIQYSKFLKGMDRKDHILFNAHDKKTFRWYTKLWTYILETLMLNSYNLYKKYSSNTKMNFYEFRLNVIDCLLFENAPVDKSAPKGAPDHLPLKFERAEGGYIRRKRCKLCYRKGLRKNTPYYCPKCIDQPGLCLDPCFRLFHTE